MGNADTELRLIGTMGLFVGNTDRKDVFVPLYSKKEACMCKETPLIINVPHSSLLIPAEEIPFFDKKRLIRELMVMTDHCCDDLFDTGHDMLVFPVSRLVCDAERFREDRQEIMAERGMGAVYTKCSDLSFLRHLDEDSRERILRTYYDPYHSALERLTTEKMNMFGRCLIVDGHSFYESPLPYEMNQNAERPDICIGTDEYHTLPVLQNRLCRFFEENGYTVTVNAPFAGTIVPIKYYREERRVQSVMIEINRRLYITADGCIKPGFSKVKRDIARAVNLLEKLVLQG